MGKELGEPTEPLGIREERIAGRPTVEEQLRRSEELLHSSVFLLILREEERTRVARAIHDELGQGLTALMMDFSWVRPRLPVADHDLHQKIHIMTHLVDGMVQAVRRIATALRPGVLDDLGLVAALEWQIQEFQGRTGLACGLTTVPEEIALDSLRATAMFRICQEVLTNITRHAGASRVDVHLTQTGDILVLEVRDDGKGISEHAVTDPKSLGLMSMRERILPWKGEVWIRGVDGGGTVVRVTLPLGDG
jgi:signal transduction histidine kinase